MRGGTFRPGLAWSLMSGGGGSSRALRGAWARSLAVSPGWVSSAKSRRNISKIIGLSSTNKILTLAAMRLLLHPSIHNLLLTLLVLLILAAVFATLAP